MSYIYSKACVPSLCSTSDIAYRVWVVGGEKFFPLKDLKFVEKYRI